MDYLIYKSLFPNQEFIEYPKNLYFIPSNCFGSFVSIKRTKISEFPYDVHGCIGNYGSNFANKSKEEIYKIVLDVGHSALYNDDRRKSFSPIYNDSQAKFEIELMLNPVLEINKSTGMIKGTNEYFNNDDYGLIYKGPNNSATYLPKVFENISWNSIKERIKRKSNNINSNGKFYAFRTKKISKKIISIIPTIRNKIFNSFLNFNNQYFIKEIPYILQEKNNIIYDSNQYVRNNGTLYDLYVLGFNNVILNKSINKYYNLFLKNKSIMRQASAFLLLCLEDSHKIEIICKYLLKNINNLEPNFERGEVLIGLIDKCNSQNIIFDAIQKMHVDFETQDVSIFRCNWEAKVLYIYKKKYSSTSFDNYAKKLMTKIELLANSYDLNTNTNYLVVTFEALMSLKNILYKRFSLNANNILFTCFYILLTRFKKDLIFFKDMKEARLDMTGHFIQGLKTLDNKS